MFDKLGEASYFSKLDLKTDFHLIRISPKDIKKTEFKIKYGYCELLVLPMGLQNGPATFHALMNGIFRDIIDDYLVIYHDDILIYSNSREEHLQHLRTALQRLKENEVYVEKKNKYELMTTETEFLGLHFGTSENRVCEDWKES